MSRLLIVLFLLTMITNPAQAGDTISIGVDSWPPYIESNSQTEGLATQIVRKAFASQGIDVNLVFTPWARCLYGVEHGELAATFPWYETEERKRYAWFSNPIINIRTVLFHDGTKHTRLDFQDLENLRPLRLCGIVGAFYKPEFDEAGLDINYTTDINFCFRMLEAGRVDGVVEDEVVGWDILRKNFPKLAGHAAVSIPFRDEPSHVVFSRKYPGGEKLLEAFNAGLQSLKESGEYDRILERYRCIGGMTQ